MNVTATYANGEIANLWGSFAAEDMAREPWSYVVKVMGSKGTGIATWDKIKYGDQPEPLWDDGGYWDSFLHVERYFVEECVGKGKQPLSTLEDARDAALIFEAAMRSMAENRQIDLEFPD